MSVSNDSNELDSINLKKKTTEIHFKLSSHENENYTLQLYLISCAELFHIVQEEQYSSLFLVSTWN